MWPLPSSAAIPIGNPFTGLSLVEAIAIATILLAGVLTVLLGRLGKVAPEIRSGQCPLDGMRVTLVTRSSAGTPLRVVYCSKWRVCSIACDRSCLPKAA